MTVEKIVTTPTPLGVTDKINEVITELEGITDSTFQGYWEAGETVEVGDVRYLTGRDNTGYVLECVGAGVTGSEQPDVDINDVGNSAGIALNDCGGVLSIEKGGTDASTAEAARENLGIVDMIGATSSTSGRGGLVPTPPAGSQDKFLSGDGTYKTAGADLSNIVNLIYPVGSLYWSKNSTNPGTLFGGTWTQIKDKFILAAGDTYGVGDTGGAATVTLTTDQMPSHTHTGSAASTGAHSHTVAAGTGGDTNGFNYGSANGSNTSPSTRSAGAHSHTLTIDATGGGQAHNNMPPYVTYYCWERTA